MKIVNECQEEIDNISSVHNTDTICQDLQFLSIFYINHAKRPGIEKYPKCLAECIVDAHLPLVALGNYSLDDTFIMSSPSCHRA